MWTALLDGRTSRWRREVHPELGHDLRHGSLLLGSSLDWYDDGAGTDSSLSRFRSWSATGID